jgi:hypothetical protein
VPERSRNTAVRLSGPPWSPVPVTKTYVKQTSVTFTANVVVTGAEHRACVDQV